MNKYGVGSIVAGAVVLVGLIGFFQGESHVGIGHVGMVKHPDGQVTEVGQGWHWTGLSNAVEEYPTFLQGTEYQINAGTADSQKMPMQININWQLNTKDATTLYDTVGGQSIGYVQKNIIDQKVQGVVQQVTHQYTWDALLGSQMPTATKQIQTQLASTLAQDGIVLDQVYIGEVSAPAGMQNAQQQTAQAELGKEKAQAQQDQIKIENQTALLQAENNLKIKGLEAQANDKVSKSLNSLLVQQEAIAKWNGQLPTTMAGNGSVPFLNIGK